MEDRKFIVTDAEGNEKEMYIMFTTKLEETQKSYIFYRDFSNEEAQVYVSTFDGQGTLGAVETEEEWKILEDIFNQYVQEMSQKNCNSNGCCGGCGDSCECDGQCDCEGTDCQCECENKNN